MKILLIDAFDSFVYIIANYLEVLGCEVDVVRHHQIHIDTIGIQYDAIILGPGPGHPIDSGYLAVLQAYEGKLPIFGVCLGMQAIGAYYGVSVIKADHRRHGKVSAITHMNIGCFSGLPSPLQVTRYHSLIVDQQQLPNQALMITAVSNDDQYVMGIQHRHYPIEGVQFHPESVATEQGMMIIKNFITNIHKTKTQSHQHT